MGIAGSEGMNDKKTLVGMAAVALMMTACGVPVDDVQDVQDVQEVKAPVLVANCDSFPLTDVCVCTGANFTGTCADLSSLSRFFMNLSTASGLTQFNDTITSIKVGPVARGKICADPGGNGNCGYLQPGMVINDLGAGIGCPGHSCSSGADFGWGCKCMNNTVTSIRVDQDTDNCSSPSPGSCAIFEDPNFNNFMVRPFGTSHDCVVLHQNGTFGYPNPFGNPLSGESGGGYGLNTDVISSVMCGSNAVLAVFSDPAFTGTEFLLQGGTPSLPAVMNDKISSIHFFP
jgi:hypothetical protein